MRYGLIGEKLGHSYSPRVHALLGDATYCLHPLPPEELDGFLSRRLFEGINITIPYKQAAMKHCAEITPTACRIGSINTIVKRKDGTLLGDNTDAFGFEKMAQRAGIRFAGCKVLVLGSGGTSLTACHVIRQGKGGPLVISRDGSTRYEDLDKHRDAQVIVNTTPVGMYPNGNHAPVDLSLFPKLTGVLDVVYNPLRTRLLQQAMQLGIPCAGGLTMLVWQAARARYWFDGADIAEAVVNGAERALRKDVSNLVLVGMPGCGKTTLGTMCARALKRAFVDIDAEIVKQTGKSIPEIFAEHGEAEFRRLEAETIEHFGKQTGLVLATGGGAVLNGANRQNLRMNGIVIQLQRPLEALSTQGRPLSKDLTALTKMQAIRAPYYQSCADSMVDNAGTIEQCMQAVLEGYDEALRGKWA